MAWGKTAEQKLAEQASRDEEIRAQTEASAVGQAIAAHQRGDRLFTRG